MASGSRANAAEIDRLATTLAKDPASKAFIPLAEEYGKAGMWSEAAGVLEDGLKHYPGFITAMVALGRAYDQLSQPTKAKAILEEAIKISPENLRAHRTLAKIYTAEGSTAAALRSCDVILSLNPLDQESLSLRTALGVSKSTDPEAPTSKSTKAGATTPLTASVTPPPSSAAAAAEIATPTSETTRATPVAETPARDTVAEATAIVTTALEAGQPETPQPASIESSVTPEPAVQQTASSSPSRSQATVDRLEHMLQSIHARRRDRPSPETTASPS